MPGVYSFQDMVVMISVVVINRADKHTLPLRSVWFAAASCPAGLVLVGLSS